MGLWAHFQFKKRLPEISYCGIEETKIKLSDFRKTWLGDLIHVFYNLFQITTIDQYNNVENEHHFLVNTY